MKDSDQRPPPELAEAIERAANGKARSIVEIDTERYQAFLGDPALSVDQKAEIIEALWSIILAFVELGCGVHPVQQACGKPGTELEHARNSESIGLQSKHRKQPDEEAPALK